MTDVELIIRGQISTLPVEDQKLVKLAMEQIIAVSKVVGETNWLLAIALLGAKMSGAVTDET
jgi:hypothetical protein